MTWMVPLASVPNQTTAITLGGQSTRLFIYQRSIGLLVDVAVNDALVIGGVLAHDRCRIVRDAYLGFSGDLAFVDQQSYDDPDYTGLGTRWLLFWYPPEEIPP
jgi:hypothetical protein